MLGGSLSRQSYSLCKYEDLNSNPRTSRKASSAVQMVVSTGSYWGGKAEAGGSLLASRPAWGICMKTTETLSQKKADSKD